MATKRFPMILVFCLSLILSISVPTEAQLTPRFYDYACPQAIPTIRAVVERAIQREPRLGASLLRLHFHDCFVNGCDGSVLLDDMGSFVGEKMAPANNNSARGFEVVDMIKQAVNEVCYGNVVSCADILAVAARDSISMLGGPHYDVKLGRRDARAASLQAATSSIPAPTFDLDTLLSNFRAQGLSLEDLVVLSGAHTLGFAQCFTFRNRIYNKTDVDPRFANQLKWSCPQQGGDNNLSPLDESPLRFDLSYFRKLTAGKGLLNSDQELFRGNGGSTDGLVRYYSGNWRAFSADFAVAMVKMGDIRPLTGNQGEIRMNCRRIN